jgi:hypothetical protein
MPLDRSSQPYRRLPVPPRPFEPIHGKGELRIRAKVLPVMTNLKRESSRNSLVRVDRLIYVVRPLKVVYAQFTHHVGDHAAAAVVHFNLNLLDSGRLVPDREGELPHSADIAKHAIGG